MAARTESRLASFRICLALLYRSGPDQQRAPIKIGADAWFDRRGVEEVDVLEQTYRVPGDEVLTIVTLVDQDMFEAGP